MGGWSVKKKNEITHSQNVMWWDYNLACVGDVGQLKSSISSNIVILICSLARSRSLSLSPPLGLSASLSELFVSGADCLLDTSFLSSGEKFLVFLCRLEPGGGRSGNQTVDCSDWPTSPPRGWFKKCWQVLLNYSIAAGSSAAHGLFINLSYFVFVWLVNVFA